MESEAGDGFDLDGWYNSGKPIFTKEAMQNLSSQLRDNNRSNKEKIMVSTLWGKPVSNHEPDQWLEETEEPDEEYTWTPQCAYSSIESLQVSAKDPDQPTDNLYGVSLSWRRDSRNKSTKARILRPPDASAVESAQRFQQMLEKWKESEAWTAMERLLRANFSHPVGELIAFAGGRFSMRVEMDQEPRENDAMHSTVQHCILLLVREVLRDLKVSDEKTVCCAQDPDYTDVDVAVLRQNDIQVLDDPDGFLKADSTSCVLSFAPNVAVRQVIIDVARPALMIWDSIGKGEHLTDYPGHLQTDPVSSRVRKVLDEEYHCFDLPEDDNFSPLTLYIRRSK